MALQQGEARSASYDITNAREIIDHNKISLFQWQILAICFSIILLDGFDAQVIGATAPFLAESLGVSVRDFGPVFGAGHFGPMIGAITVGMVADRWGRKSTLLVATVAFGVLTLAIASPLVTSLEALAALRFASGVALGGIAPVAMSLVSEFVPARRRGSLLGVLWVGLPAGGMMSGVASAIFAPDWVIVYVIGGLLPIAIAVIALVVLPESLQFISRKQGPKADARLRNILGRIDPKVREGEGVLAVVQEGEPVPRGAVGYLFASGRAWRTLLVWLAFFMGFFQLIFVVSWAPSMLHAIGARDDQVGWVLALLNFGSIGGTLSVGYLIDRFGPYRVLGLGFAGAGATLLAIGISTGASFEVVAMLVCVFGALGGGATGGLLMLASAIYPTAIRATAIGWAYGLGRCGAISSPMIAGALLQANWSPGAIYLLMGLPAFVAAAALAVLWASSERRAAAA